ncbi:MAG: hypothetical protein WB540_19230, partial [Pseudolabrys sp.]
MDAFYQGRGRSLDMRRQQIKSANHAMVITYCPNGATVTILECVARHRLGQFSLRVRGAAKTLSGGG